MKYFLIFCLLALPAWGAQQSIGVGAAANDGTGDPLRTAFLKSNANFTELYGRAFDSDITLWAGITPAAGVGTVLATPSSANLLAALTDETGTGSAVFGTSPTLTTPSLGTPSALVGTNITGTAAGLTAGITNALKSATTTVSVAAATAPTSGQVLMATSSIAATWQTVTGTGDVTAAAAFGTDNRLIRSDGTGKGTQATGITVSDVDAITGIASMVVTGSMSTPSLLLTEAAAPATPAASKVTFYAKTDGLIYGKDDAGAETALSNDAAALSLKAPLAAPTFTGISAAPTAATGTSTTQLATTAFVQAEVDTTQTGVHATPSTTNPLAPTWSGPTQLIWYGATGEVDLPAAAGYTGRGLILYNTGAFTVTFDPNASEVIVRDGTVQTGGVSFTLSTGAGNYVAIVSDGARWVTLGFKGTLTAGT
jgi:hypothetical protein